MTRRSSAQLLARFTTLTLSLAISGCQQASHESTGSPAPAITQVKAGQVERKSLRRTTEQPGYIEAFEQASLYAKVAGFVEKLHVDIGDHVTGPSYDKDGKLVRAGQILVDLSIPELNEERLQKKAQHARSRAQIEQAQAQVKVSEAAVTTALAQIKQGAAQTERAAAEFDRWTSEYARIAELGRSSAVPQKAVDEAKNQLRAADAARTEAAATTEAAQAMLVESQARVEKARADAAASQADEQVAAADYRRLEALVEYATIRAPFDGIISTRNIDVGHFVQPSETGQDNPLLVVIHADTVRVFVDVPENDAALADDGDVALIRVDALGDVPLAGHITRTSWALNTSTRTLRVEIDVPNHEGKLRPGMYAYATLVLDERADALVLPRSAILRAEQQSYCYVVRDGKATRTPVSLGLEANGNVEVVSGLTGDEIVVLSGIASLADGQAVELIKTAAPPSASK